VVAGTQRRRIGSLALASLGMVGAGLLAPGMAAAAPAGVTTTAPTCAGADLAVHWDPQLPEPDDYTGDTDAIPLDSMTMTWTGQAENSTYVTFYPGEYSAGGVPMTVSITSMWLVTIDRPEGFAVTADEEWSIMLEPGDFPITADATGCAVPTNPPATDPAPTATPEPPAADPVAPTPPVTTPVVPVGTVEAPRVAAGGTQTVTATGFLPGESVRGTLHSTPIDLGLATADADGRVSWVVALPVGFEAGPHSVEMVGLTSGRAASVGFTVTVPGTTPATLAVTSTVAATGEELAYTGSDVAVPLSVGLAAVAGGAALLVVGRRRTAQQG
jgi:hypothetical protein